MSQTIQDPTVGVALQRLFGLQGRVRPALEEFVIPTVQIADLTPSSPPAVSRHATALISQAAVAAERATLRFEAIPGTICRIRALHLWTPTAANFTVDFPGNAATLAALANTAAKSFTDGRLLAGAAGGAQQPSAVLTFGTQVAVLIGTPFRIRIPADGLTYEPPGGWIVGTGNAGLFGFLEAQLEVPNQELRGSIEWDEYALI